MQQKKFHYQLFCSRQKQILHGGRKNSYNFDQFDFTEEKAAFEQRMKDRKVKRAMDERKKLQGDRNARHAFKDKLEENTKE